MDFSNLEVTQIYDGTLKEHRVKTFNPDFKVGMAAAVKEYYEKNLGTVPGVLSVGSVTIETTPKVMAALKAVLYAGCCRIELRAAACREVFTAACKAGSPLTEKKLIASFTESDNPFTQVLQDTLRGLLNE